MSALKLLILLSLIGGLSACAGRAPVPPPLELRAWDAPGRPKAVILALHSFGDYSAAFDLAAPDLAAAGYQVYGFDQAGFGARTLADGRWAGEARLVADAAEVADPASAVARLNAAWRQPDVIVLGMGEDGLGGGERVFVRRFDTKGPAMFKSGDRRVIIQRKVG